MHVEEPPTAKGTGLSEIRAPSAPLAAPSGRVNGSLAAGGRVNGGFPPSGRVNGSFAAGGRVNGSRIAPHAGSTNGRSAGLHSARGGRGSRGLRAKALAVALAFGIVLPSLLWLAAGQDRARFAADGDFSEWQGVASVPDADGGENPGPDLRAVRLVLRERVLFVEAESAFPILRAEGRSAVRIFVDADADPATGFDLGDLGADVMLEAVAEGPSRVASGLFAFQAARAPDDWHGWARAGPAAVAFEGSRFEAALPGLFSKRAGAVVALSVPGAEDVLDPPASLEGVLVLAQETGGPQVLAEGARGVELLKISLSATGRGARVGSLEVVPSGPADFSALESARLVLPDGRSLDAVSQSPGALAFEVDPPLGVEAGSPSEVRLLVDVAAGRAFTPLAGQAFGARLAGAGTGEAPPLLLIRPRELAPAAYLGFVAAAPVVDGAFGEWRLAGAAEDPADPETLPGEDLIGVRAMTSGHSGAFFAETRGAILEGPALREMPQLVEMPAEAQGPAAAGGIALPPAPREEPSPLSTDDRLLVYFDADGDSSTGFRPARDVPIGAEFVVEVAGRFSLAARSQLLEFAGSSPFESRWVARGHLKAAAQGSALEGEIPEEVIRATGSARAFFQTVAWTGRTGDLSDALQDVALEPASPENLLQFRAVTFDPLRGPAPIRESLRLEAPNGYWVVQLKAAPTSAVLGALESAGATLYGYVHSNAYLAAMDLPEAEVVRSMDEVRWVGVYEPAFKFPVDPAAWGDGSLTLLALLFTRPRDLEAQVEGVGGEVLSATDSSLRVRIDGRDLEAFARLPSIQYIDLENQRVPLNDVARALQGVNLTYSRDSLDGSNIVVGISDTGIDFTHPAFDDTGNSSSGPHFDGRILAYYTYGGAYGDSNGHGTHTAGSVAGDGDLSETANNSGAAATSQFRGAAPAAALVVTEILGSSPPSDDKVFADQEAFGATVSSNSWGYVDAQNNPITDYDTSAYLTDQSVIDSNTSRAGLQPMTIVFAAGNDGAGAGTVGSPGTAKNIISVGASESNRGYDAYADNASSIASFSSRGPTDDRRAKPDVVAVGTYILSAQSRTSGCSCTYGGWDASWTGANYAFSSGTSQATPHVAGIAALIQQGINDTLGRVPSPALVKAALINGAEDLGYGFEFTGGVTGAMSQGWGRVNVTRSIDGPPNGTILLFEEGPVVATGNVAIRRFNVLSSSTPLKATVVWTDQPGNPQDTKTLAELVNDLDVTVRAPNGTTYHGNRFQGSWSRPNQTAFDRLNNTENVFVSSPATGTWTLEVSGYLVKSAAQKFALAVSGNLTARAPPSVADVHAVPGVPANAKFGWNLSAVGSVNGDGFADLVVGAPGTGGGNGSVYIFFGGSGESFASLNVTLADVTINGTAGEAFGSAVDTSGDYDGDGTDDLIVGAPEGGKAYLFYGAESWSSPSPAVTFGGFSADRFGSSVLLAPIDNRSGAEAVVGAPQNASQRGAVFVFGGTPPSSSWNASAANATLQGTLDGWRLGTALASGDADGDSKAELAVGAPGAALVRMARGGGGLSAFAFNATFTGVPGTAFGQSLTLGGDVNDDGKDDLIVGAPFANDSAGAAYVFFGASPLADDEVIRYYFFDDLEGGTSKWQEMSGSANGSSPWSLSSSVFYGPAGSGHSWQDSSGAYGNSEDASIAFAAGVNLSGATAPLLTFVYRADLEATATNYDGFLVKYTVDSGANWIQLNADNSEGNYDTIGYDPPGPPVDNTPITDLYAFTYDRFVWRQVTFNLTPLAGNASVKLRFQFGSDSAVNSDGVYLDDIAVREARPSSPDVALYGEGAGDLFGFAVAPMGDANGDGAADFAVGAPSASPGGLAGAGQAFVFTGSATLNGTNTSANAAEVLSGTSAGGNLGWSLAPLAGFNVSQAVFLVAGTPGLSAGGGGASVGNATSPIPEFGSVAIPGGLAALVSIGLRRNRRRAA